MTGISSSAALATLTVAAPVLEKDVLLKLVTIVASNKQFKVVTKKKGNDCSLELLHGEVLTQRNAILRALAGPAFHHALDSVFLGGHSAAARNGGSVVSALALSSLDSWMTVASNLRTGSVDATTVLDQLETYLEEKSFLIPSSSATLADMDLCTALMVVDAGVPFGTHVSRWMHTVHAQMADLGAPIQPLPIEPAPIPMPMFFYGTEDFVPAAEPTKKNAKGKGAPKPDTSGLTDEQKQKAAEKRAKKNAEKAAKKKKAPAAPAPATAELDITALDIRIGKILKAWHHPDAEKLFCEEIDLGEDQPRQIASGLRPFYQTEDLENRMVLVLANLKARNLVGFPSHGMVLCASNEDHTQVEFVVPPADAKIGERVVFGNLSGEPEAENKVAKKKMAEKLLPDLKTTAEGIVVWKEHQANTSAGPVKALKGMPNAHVG